VCRKVAVGRKMPGTLRVQLGLVFVFGVLFSGRGGSDEGEMNDNIPSAPEEAGSVVIRISGAEGTAYAGNYETIEGELEIVEETTLGSEPVDYEVEIQEDASDGVTAFSRRPSPVGRS
jgi:hypothetical protein